jgi:hypothetical protein
VKVNRIGISEPEAPEEVEEVAMTDDISALVRYAAAFENADNLPVMSMVFIDDGTINDPHLALNSLGFPVTVVLDASGPNVADKMNAYRAAGIEVGVRASLPANAAPSDVAVALEATFAALPEAVLLFDGGVGGLQNDRAAISQAMSNLAQSGRGYLSVFSGLNVSVREADKLNVPAGVIYRDLDGEGQDAAEIRRLMDQAAFRARQDGGVVLMARLHPDTNAALQLWGAESGRKQVALAPVSAILMSKK